MHSGPVSGVVDVNEHANVAGAGINTAQRVMDCGDAGHILLSKRVAEDLAQYDHWQPHLHDLGEVEVKHGVRVHVVNLYTEDLGNPQLPKNFQSLKKHSTRVRWAEMTGALLALAAIIAGIAIFSRYRVRSTPVASQKSIVVLPFDNLSRDPENAYFSEGFITNIIISALITLTLPHPELLQPVNVLLSTSLYLTVVSRGPAGNPFCP